jgi:hypothetical protein
MCRAAPCTRAVLCVRECEWRTGRTHDTLAIEWMRFFTLLQLRGYLHYAIQHIQAMVRMPRSPVSLERYTWRVARRCGHRRTQATLDVITATAHGSGARLQGSGLRDRR